MDLKNYFQVQNHLFSLLDADDVEEMTNWFDGRPNSMFLTIATRNKAAIQYALSQGLLDEEATIQSAIRDYLQRQGVDLNSMEEVVDEFLIPGVTLRQRDDSSLFVDLWPCLVDE